MKIMIVRGTGFLGYHALLVALNRGYSVNTIAIDDVELGDWYPKEVNVQYGAKDYFYSDSKCTGCGICQKVCSSGKIKMVKDKPSWQKNIKCYLCYACLNLFLISPKYKSLNIS